MQNEDGDLSFTGATPEKSAANLRELVEKLARGQVKTLTYSIGAGSDILYYQTKVASTWGWRKTKYDANPTWGKRIERCRLATEADLDAPRLAGTRAKELGMRFFPSYRMNDSHYCSDPLNYPLTGRFWMEHQKDTLGRSPVEGYPGYEHLLDYGKAAVRAYRLAIIEEAIERYADLMDGFELDFNRVQIFFAPGEAEKNASLMTDLVKAVRAKLDAAGQKAGRHLWLVARVAPTMANCRWAGLEVDVWMKQRLVDVVIPAQVMTLAHDMPVDGFVQAAAGTGCQVYGSIYGRAGYSWPFAAEHGVAAYAGEVSRLPTVAQVRGAIMNQRFLGAAGFEIYNFNYFDADPALMNGVWSALAKPMEISRLDRRYQITPAYFCDREDSYEYRKQVPAPLRAGEKTQLRLLVGEDLAAASPRPKYAGLRLGFYSESHAYAGMELSVALNGHELHAGLLGTALVVTKGKRHGNGSHPPPTEAYAQWAIADLSWMRAGWNEISLTWPGKPPAAIQVVEAELGVLAP